MNNLKELKEIREAFQWTWDNMDKPHTSDHFNIPANGIQALDNLIEAAQPSSGNAGEENKPANDFKYPSETAKLWDWHSTAIHEDAEGGAEEIAEMVAGKSVMFEDDFKKALQRFAASHTPEQGNVFELVKAVFILNCPYSPLTDKELALIKAIADALRISGYSKLSTPEQEGEGGYWKKRCEAAERLIEMMPSEHYKTYDRYAQWDYLK